MLVVGIISSILVQVRLQVELPSNLSSTKEKAATSQSRP